MLTPCGEADGAGELRGVMAQMEALLELLEGKTPRKKEGEL